ncbi:hypothetical protein Tco_0969121 [Tanacetum coccineum]
MANTTPVVTTVMKPATKEKTPKEVDATPRVNIQDFCEEHYEDILPVIMDKIRRDKRKEVHARLDFEESPKKRRIREGSQNSSARTLSARACSTDLVILTRQAQLNPDQIQQTLGILPMVEPTLIGRTPLKEIILGAKTTPVASKNHMIIPAPPMGQGPNMDIARATEIAPVMRKRGGKVNPHHPAYQRAAPAMGDTGSQDKEDTSLWMRMTWRCPGYTYDGIGDPEDHVKNFQAAAQVERWAMHTWCHMFNSTLIVAARVWFDELPSESIDGYKDLKAAFLAYFMQQKNYVKDPGAPECMRVFEFMHGVNNPELTKRLNEHVPKTMEEMMITTTAFIRGETAAAGKKKGHTSLLVTIGDADHSTRAWMNFMILRSLSPYNGIIGRPKIREIQAVPSTAHGMLKFPADGGIVTICSTILIPTECATVITSSKEIPKQAGKKRGQAPERAKDIQTEVQKLVEAGIMREVYYHEWLSNPVMVKKHDGSWRMCMDFTDLNKACSQDYYPLPEIN